MKHVLFPLLFIAAACSTPETETPAKPSEPETSQTYADIIPVKDTLYCTSGGDFEFGKPYGYTNKDGDTVIREGEFYNCFSTIFTTFAYVLDERFGDGMVAVNRNKELIFDAYLFDNGPDYINEGLFRIKRNGKIGYADPTGKVVIPAIYSCADPFKNGKARVALDCESVSDGDHTMSKSEHWFYIDKTGKKIN